MLRKKEGVIKEFIAGEDFSIFNDPVLNLLETVSELRGDLDFCATDTAINQRIVASIVSLHSLAAASPAQPQ